MSVSALQDHAAATEEGPLHRERHDEQGQRRDAADTERQDEHRVELLTDDRVPKEA